MTSEKKISLFSVDSLASENENTRKAIIIQFRDADSCSELVDAFCVAGGYQEFVFLNGSFGPNPTSKEMFCLQQMLDFMRSTIQAAAQRQTSIEAVQEYPIVPGRE
jgi:hypothetical protein